MTTSRRGVLLASMGLFMAPRVAAQDSDLPPAYTSAMARRIEPGRFPFVADYAKGHAHLAFIAAQHAEGQDTPTAQLIRKTFARSAPRLVVVEGEMTANGRNPPRVQALRGEAGVTADPRASENRIAAETALRAGVDVIGGEPDEAAIYTQHLAAGFAADDVRLADLLKVIPQLVRTGYVKDAADPRFAAGYPTLAALRAEALKVAPLPFDRFRSRYAEVFGVAPDADKDFIHRNGPGDETIVARILQREGQLRDRNLLAVIREGLEREQRVLVVYGGSHWTTLSAPLEAMLGAPTFDLSLSPRPS